MTPDDLKAPWEHMAEGEMLLRLRRAAPLLVDLWKAALEHVKDWEAGDERGPSSALWEALEALKKMEP